MNQTFVIYAPATTPFATIPQYETIAIVATPFATIVAIEVIVETFSRNRLFLQRNKLPSFGNNAITDFNIRYLWETYDVNGFAVAYPFYLLQIVLILRFLHVLLNF